jgi:hypothetical protein
MTEKKKNSVDRATELSKIREKRLESRRRNILESIDRLDAAAEKKTEDIEKLHPAKTQDVLWILKKHSYEGWS